MSHFFTFIHEYIVLLCSLSYTLSLYPPPFHWYQSLSCSVFEKKDIFVCLIAPLFFSFYLSPILMVVSKGLKILYSFLFRKYINHIHLLNFHYSPSSISDFPLTWPVFHNIACICIGSVFHIWEKTFGLWLSEPG
jgi:hypothetical protein